MESTGRIELNDVGVRRLVTAIIADALRVVAFEQCDDRTYFEAAHAGQWLLTTGSEWAEATGFSINRHTFRAAVNGHLARHELAAALRDVNKPAKRPKSYQLNLPISE